MPVRDVLHAAGCAAVSDSQDVCGCLSPGTCRSRPREPSECSLLVSRTVGLLRRPPVSAFLPPWAGPGLQCWRRCACCQCGSSQPWCPGNRLQHPRTLVWCPSPWGLGCPQLPRAALLWLWWFIRPQCLIWELRLGALPLSHTPIPSLFQF